jgi:hypothetical protein
VPLRILCPHCQKLSDLEGAQPAGEVACPACGGKFALRRPPEALLGPDPPAARPPNGPGPVVAAPAAPPPAPAEALAGDPAGLAPGWRPDVVAAEEPMRPLTLEGGPPLAWIDRVLPSRPHWFLLVVLGLSIGCWLLGFLLAADRPKFLQTREWYAQLIYLPAHFIALRLFVTLYTRNFMAGVRHLTVPLDLAWRRMRWVLGPVGLLSLLLAAPLSARDFFDLDGDKYRDSLVGPVRGRAWRRCRTPRASSSAGRRAPGP